MQKIITIILLSGCLTSCISSKKINSIVDKYYLEKNTESKTVNKDIIVKKSKTPSENFSKSKRTKAQFIPAILYWKWHTNVNASIDDNMVGSRFNQFLASKYDSLELFNILDNHKIEFEFLEAPNGFSYVNKGNSIILIVAYTVSELIAIFPEKSPYRLKYKILDSNNSKIKEGEVEMMNLETPLKKNSYSVKRFTWSYLDQYHKNQNIVFENLIQKIEKELKDSL